MYEQDNNNYNGYQKQDDIKYDGMAKIKVIGVSTFSEAVDKLNRINA